MNVTFAQEIKDVNDKLVSSNKQHFASMSEIEWKLARISKKLEERPTGKFGGQTQPNPAQSQPNMPSGTGKYVPPSSKTEHGNVIISVFGAGNDQRTRKQEMEAGQQPRDQWASPSVPTGGAHLPEQAWNS